MNRHSARRTKTDVVEEFRKASIQDAALRVVSRRGLEGTSMQAVAAEAGIAKGTIYLYFKSREDLLESAAERTLGELRRQLAPLLSEDNREPFPVLLRKLVETKLAFFHLHRDFFRLYRDISNAERGPGASCEKYQRYLTALAGVLRRAMKRGEVRRGDPDRLALFVAAGVHAVLLERLSDPKPRGARGEAAWIVDLLSRGLAVSGGEA
jgi:AcrR family transcriptional regulator